ncbi:MAG TPA: ABC transporter substrate-binding protein [Ilumatobacteraceae bacterium]|nr:ABC transporter substrate-binding protein [Ilumatobacteraceae bacterium]
MVPPIEAEELFMRIKALVGIVAGLSLLATACGDDDTTGDPADTGDAADETVGSATTATSPDIGATTPATELVGAATTEPATGPVPARIISLSPTATEMLFAIGAGDQVIAVDNFSNFPPEAAAKMTELSGYEPNVEAIAGYEPDLVATDGTNPALLEQLDSLGIPHWEGAVAITLDDTYAQIEQLGAATGHVAEAAELVANMQADIAEVIAGIPAIDEPLTYYHELDSSYFSATSDTFIGFVYSQLGLRNIADQVETSAGPYPQLNAEFIISADPDLIFLACTKYCGETAESVAGRDGWGELSAVTTGGVVEMDDDIASRWGPRVVDYLQQASEAVNLVVATQPAG